MTDRFQVARRRPWALSPAAIGSLLMCSACSGRDVDRPWGLAEVRISHLDGDQKGTSGGGVFSVSVPLGVTRKVLALAARDSLVIGKGVSIYEPTTVPHARPPLGFVSSLGRAKLLAGAAVGAVYSLGNTPLELADNVYVSDYVKTSVVPRQSQLVHIGMGLVDHASRYSEEFRWSIDFSSNRDDAVGRADAGVPLDMQPGGYRAVVVESGGSAVLHHGTYSMESLDLRRGGALEIDNTEGPVYVWVHSALVLAGDMLDYVMAPNVLFGYAGGSPPVIATLVRATLVAPNAAIALPKASTPHVGAFFARDIEVADEAMVEHRPFKTDARFDPPSVVCSACALDARQSVRTCCNAFERSSLASQMAVSVCLAACSVEAADAGCAVDCRASLAPDSENARAALGACVLETTSAYAGCEGRNGYRPGICHKLGFRREAPSCDGQESARPIESR